MTDKPVFTETDKAIQRELAQNPHVDPGAEGLDIEGPPPDPTVLHLDQWSKRRGEESLESAPKIRKQYRNAGYSELEAEDAAADFVGMSFLPHYKKTNNPEDQYRRAFVDALEESPEYVSMKADTVMDALASEIASWHMSSQYIEFKQEQEKRAEEEGEGEGSGAPGGEEMKDAAREAAGKAAGDASDEVESLNDIRDAIGLGQGDDGNRIPKEELLAMFQRVKGSDRLKAICQYLGRFRRMAQAQQRYRIDAGQEEMVGVTMGGPLEQILPSELAGLADNDMQYEVMRKIVEREYMSWDYDGFAKRAKGPIVVVVDESGSMDGDRVHMAKAIALSLYWVASYQNRWVCLVGFSGGRKGNWLTIKPGESKPNELLDWLEHFYCGGTTCDVPLVELPKKWKKLGCPEGKTDVVVITDAMLRVPDKVKNNFNNWKAESQAKMVTIVIGDQPGDLEAVSDATFSVADLDIEQEAVRKVLSI